MSDMVPRNNGPFDGGPYDGGPPALGGGATAVQWNWGTRSRRRLVFEVLLVLGLSLGQSGVYAVVQLLDKMSRAPLAQGTSTLNAVRSNREFFDLTYQLLDIFFAVVPVFLVLYLMAEPGKSVFRRIGLDFRRPVRDGLGALGLLVVIGVPSLGLYAAGRALGITTEIIPSALHQYWWTIPVLVLSAIHNGLLEEVVMVGWLLDRLGRMGMSSIAAILLSSLIRGSYHLYQGFGPFFGNFVMGLLFCWLYKRYGRVMPLVVAHSLVDIAAFTMGPALGFG
ncbi:CPBP family intramembrane glutamic endopeptidase [Arthrobacter sp. SDTb3-6]|uniref:CPBP family intramembrane glutamic endopeptidase n=1 Tax=Arthrobacter sp. SDTb3-6 TaxID=2713571 RepID=UPI00210BEC62|nr:type II CAAX endopeptidase family protein [Arthrobacter sp. SDTb3-6]